MFQRKTIYQWLRNTVNNKVRTRSETTNKNKIFVYTLNTSLEAKNLRGLTLNRNINTSASIVFKSSTMSGDAKCNEPAKEKRHTNKLAESKSPYLLQHMHNPVNWYPWNEEAFERARQENKLIFLSVGYSTCHWCHVMERESFENESVAAIMNEHFVNIKVDREERPDIDKIYMQFLLLTKGSGGWPMSVWLTPDLAPILAGTYFPPKNRWGMPSFTSVLTNIAKKWETDKESLQQAGSALITAMQQSLTNQTGDSSQSSEPDDIEIKLQESLHIYKQRFDQTHGGFGSHPKFPEVSRLNFLFHSYIVTKDADILDMVIQTLDHIGRGGINDHIFGGFARYAVDRNWHVPHFEKMLYDQGQLMAAYANGYKITRNEKFLFYADNIFRYLMQDLRHPLGGFFAGEDADSLPTYADSVKIEGAFYAWSSKDIETAIEKNVDRYKLELSAERIFEIYAFHYGILPNGNVEPASDPHGHITKKNILIVRGTEADTCANFNITEAQLTAVLKVTNEILYELRKQRPRPHLDTKIICAWNGLVLSGLSKLANCGSSKRDEYLQAAKSLVGFAREHFFDKKNMRLLRSCYGQSVTNDTLETTAEQINGFLDDYAFLIKGLLDYYKSSLDCSALHWAKDLQDLQDKLFWDDKNGAYFFSESTSNVVLRMKEDHDGAEPSGNSVSARNLILLSHYYDDENYSKRAEQLFKFFSNVSGFGHALPEMTSALLLHEHGLDLVAVVGPESADTTHFVEICRKFYIPGMIILHVNPHNPDDACNQRVQQKFKMVNGKTTVYICHDRVCQMPVTDPAALEENLTQNFFQKLS